MMQILSLLQYKHCSFLKIEVVTAKRILPILIKCFLLIISVSELLRKKTGRDFTNYMADDIEKYNHPHPGIRMYCSIILYTYWLMNFFEENKEIITIYRERKPRCHRIREAGIGNRRV